MRAVSEFRLLLLIPLLWLLVGAAVVLAQSPDCPPGSDRPDCRSPSRAEGRGEPTTPFPFDISGQEGGATYVATASSGATRCREDTVVQDPRTWQPDPGAVVTLGPAQKTNVNGVTVPMQPVDEIHTGMYLPDGQGGYYWVGEKNAIPTPNPNNEAAIEIRLKVKELADQLLGAGGATVSVGGMVIMPSSFVHQDRYDVSSSFGRYIAEQMIHEFTSRGLKVREYHLQKAIDMRPGEGDFAMSRRGPDVSVEGRNVAVLTGTYYWDKENIFVNARLVRGSDDEVLRTGSLVFAQSEVSQKMLKSTGKMLGETYVGVRDFDIMTKGPGLTDIDRGYDIK
ncbi:FlgO family outer membrane protein [Megalodesulfovibrio paquesii]